MSLRLRRALAPFQVASLEADAVPELPEDATELDDSGLMVLYRKLVAWCEYADHIHAEALTEEKRAEQELEKAEASTTARSALKTVSSRRAEASITPEVQAAKTGQLDAFHTRKRAENAVRLVERRVALVSREITRRAGSRRER